jgi:nucleotide-binding universal stress UspA family protein
MAYQYGPVVAGVDGSAHSIGALRWAADEAHRLNRMLLVVHARAGEDVPGGKDIAAQAAAEARRWRIGVASTHRTEPGPPVAVLRRHATLARLLVVGCHGADAAPEQPTQAPAAGKPVGSVSEALGVWADCPVLVVHGAQRWAAHDAVLPRDGPVVAGYDGSDSARRALRLAFEEASGRGGRLVLMQAWAHPDLWHPGRPHGADLTADQTAVDEALRAAAAPWCARYPLVTVEVRHEPRDPVEALTVASQWATLMVLGTRCPADPQQPPSPSVMRQVLAHAACPVLVAHGPGS